VTLGRRRGDDREVAQPGHRHVEGARDGRGGEGQQVDLAAQRLQPLLLPDAEPVLLVDDNEPEGLELDVGVQQPVRADHDVDLARRERREDLCDLLGRAEA